MSRYSLKKLFRLLLRNWFFVFLIAGMAAGHGIVRLSGAPYLTVQISETSVGQSESTLYPQSGSDSSFPQTFGGRSALFISVMQHRLPCFLLLLVCGATAAAAPVYILFVCHTGITQGILLTLYVSQSGWHGLWAYAAALMPHSICYSIAYLLLFRYPWRTLPPKKHSRILLLMFMFLILGVFLEVYTNSNLSAQ